MPTPHVIEADSADTGFVGVSYYDFGPNQDLGPWEHGGNRYVGYCRVNYTSFDQFTAIASTSDAINFTVHDPTNAPRVGQTAFLGAAGSVCADNAVSKLYTCYYDSARLSIVPFDLTTNLYGAVLSGGPIVTNHVIINSIRMLSTGVLLVMYGTDQGEITDLHAVTCTTSGIWGSPVVVAASNNSGPDFTQVFGMSMVPDSAGRAHILYFKSPTLPDTKEVRYCMWDSGVVSGDARVGDGWFPYSAQGTGRYDAVNDRVLMPFQVLNFIGTDGQGLLLVNSASTTPALVQDIVLPFNSNLAYFGCYISLDGSTYFFTYEDYTTTEQVITYQRAANSPGSWTGPTTFWNYDTDPPPDDPANPGIPTIEQNPPSGLVPLSSGSTGTLISFFGGGGAVGKIFCNTLYYMESVGAPVQTLHLIKTVSGGTASPTDFILSADGPTPISGAGGVGPSNVDAGTYTLSETSVAGYTAGTWDCGGAEMPTANSVVVPAGGQISGVTTPHIINSPNSGVQGVLLSYNFRFGGPIPFNGNIYSFISQDTNGSGTHLTVWKKTSSGSDPQWSRLNSAGEVTAFGRFNLDAWWTPGDSKIYCAYCTESSTPFTIKLISFNLSTETWDAPITAGAPSCANETGGGAPRIQTAKYSDGSRIVVYPSTPTQQLAFRVYSGGWGSETILSPIPVGSGNLKLQEVFVDSSDVAHCLYGIRDTITLQVTIWYFTVTGGVLAGPVSTGFTQDNDFDIGYGFEASSDGTINFPYTNTLVNFAPSTINLLKVHPAGPTFTSTLVYTASPLPLISGQWGIDSPWMTGNSTGASLYIAWRVSNQPGPPSNIFPFSSQFLWSQSTNSGATWSSPTVLYDTVTTPASPLGPQNPGELQNGGTMRFLADNATIGIVFNYRLITVINDIDGTGYYVETTSTPADIVCTILNTFSGISPPPPPDTCIIFVPTTPSPSLVAYDEPRELKGS